MMFSLLRFGAARNRARPRIASGVCLTSVAAIVVTPAAMAIVVAKAGTTVVTVETVRVATPPRVPEVAWAPLWERPGLGLGYASRFQTDESQARGNDKCRYCNASNVFHA